MSKNIVFHLLFLWACLTPTTARSSPTKKKDFICTNDSLFEMSQPGDKLFHNSDIYHIFTLIVGVCGYDEAIFQLATALEISQAQAIKVIDCFGDKIPVVWVTTTPYLMLYEKILFVSVLGLFLLISVVGNLSLLFYLTRMRNLFKWIILKCNRVAPKNQPTISPSSHGGANSPETFKVTDLFFINCAVFDLLFALFIVTIQIADVLNDGMWSLNDFACKSYAYLNYVMLSINMITLMSVALDRYSLIVVNCVTTSSETKGCFKKLLNKITCSKTLHSMNEVYMVTVKTYAWIFVFILTSFLISVPFWVFTEKTSVVKGDHCFFITDDYMCINSWRNNEIGGSVYKIVFFILVYMVPMCTLVFCYGSISCKLSKKSLPDAGNGNPTARHQSLSKKRLIKILIIDSVFYVVCWFPFLVFMLYLCIADLLKIKIDFNFQWYAFNIMYLGPICNVALKWIFRALCSLNRLKKSLHRDSDDPRFKSVGIATPIDVSIMPNRI